MKFTQQSPMEIFESSLREEGIRISDIPVDRIRRALDERCEVCELGFDSDIDKMERHIDAAHKFITVKVPSRHEVMIRRDVAQDLVK